MDELPGPSHREGTPPRRTRCRARMRDPEALQVGPGAVARLRSSILIKTSISFPSPGSAVYYLLWAGNSLRVRPIVKGLRRGGRGAEPDFNKNPNFISISRLRSLLPSARRRLDELPGPSHCEGASESLRSGKGPVSAAGRAGCGGATPEPDFNKDPNFISKSRLRSLLPALGR